MSKIEFIATAAFGLESIVALELKELGYNDTIVENGKVTFTANKDAIARCNLWLRSADRLLIKIGEFKATSFDELFEKNRKLPWSDWIPENAKFPVEGKSIQSQLFSVSDCQAIVKKSIVEKMKEKYKRKWFKENGPVYKVQVALLKDVVTLTIDTSGMGLHKRGYRKLSAEAPLKETLAAALVRISRWKPDRALIDPFCGSGTIPIEAAMIGRNIAPGINRTFAAESWNQIPLKIWKTAREEAKDSIDNSQPLGILGFDINKSVLDLARYHAQQVGLKNVLTFQHQSVNDLKSKYNYGYIISNPPYGERLSEKKDVEKTYAQMGKVFESLETWSYYILTAHEGFEKHFRRKANKKRKLYNGRIQCYYYQFYGPKPTVLKGPFAKKD
ncbi:23S rRNA (guanine(2445)-N(2))-methyltransferase [Candidatus Syntrophocurvum alkaliphilum]|uniref:23S rRNA (Guanine(2445)-N(2))-methyltransferase n=1 Tax=Candidatus Syntrophocurvum alkaliphilum TaxID=2293317 RepID=A0A6I6DBM9_9FIRM|nr:class I SAM-dependent RNA methyltransferase [Candidatus Syntrophocurvum alkaliphilum]QGU00119.1 23S rRNA (guanine(2445)-N(2))-methyltransferase [Candidatus Syntrophocurvum alkaliphilum]